MELMFDPKSWEALNGFTPLGVFKTNEDIQRWYETAQQWKRNNYYPIYDQVAEGNAFMRLAALELIPSDGAADGQT